MINEEDNLASKLTVLFIIALAAAFFVFAIYVVKFDGELSSDQSTWGTFGDYVGGVLNPVFGLLGLFALLFTIAIQSKELKLSREELSNSASALKEQNLTLELQKFETTFFQLLRFHNDIVNTIDLQKHAKVGNNIDATIMTTTGRDCFLVFEKRIRERFKEVENRQSDQPIKEKTNEAYKIFWERNQHNLGHYFRNLEIIIKFIKSNNISEKALYVDIVKAQLSDQELLILFYYCLYGNGKDSFKLLAEEFSLFENLATNHLLDLSLVDFFSPSAFAKNPQIS